MDIRVPHLADGVDSGTVVNVLVNPGDHVAKDQTIIELETEKAVAAIPAPQAGTVGQIRVKKDDKVAVGQVIATLTEGGSAAASGNGHSHQAAPVAPAPSRPAPVQAAPAPVPAQAFTRRAPPAGIPEPASPSVRRVAEELGIDLSRVQGSEHGGRIVMADLRAYVQQLQAGTAAPASSAAPVSHGAAVHGAAKPTIELPDFSKWGAVEAKPMSTLRKKISEKMSESATTVARVTQFDEVDITALMKMKKNHDDAYAKAGTKLTMSSFAVKVVVDALKKHPAFNASLDLANERIIYKKYFHIAIAVDTEQGLIVPVIKDADKKSILEISKEIDRLVAATRDRKIAVEDLQGGTFTISNQGSLGGTHFTPVVYTPQVAILGLGRARWMPVASKDGKISTRLIMPTALSYDHRVVDGGNAVRFNNDLVQGFQNFDESAIALGKPASAGKVATATKPSAGASSKQKAKKK